MEQALRDLCAKHNLSAASVSVDADYGKTSIVLYWGPQVQCAYGIADTYEVALKEALSSMNDKRNRKHMHPADHEEAA